MAGGKPGAQRKPNGRAAPVGPPNPVLTPPGQAGDPCQIVFGHNVKAQRVLMQFSRSAERLIFTPDEADDVATKLHHYAEAARGNKPA